MVVAALRAGKHVVCEKPLTSSLALADAIAAEEKRSPPASCRSSSAASATASPGCGTSSGPASPAGTIWHRSIPPRSAGPDYYAVEWRGKFATELGGVLATQAIHIHDLVFWLLGPAAAVSAFKTTRVNPIEVEDCAVASLLMADGSLVSLSATLGSARQAVRMRFCFENVTFEKLALDDDSGKPGEEPWTVIPRTPEIGRAIEAKMQEVTPQKAWFARQYELFHAAIASGGAVPGDARGCAGLARADHRLLPGERDRPQRGAADRTRRSRIRRMGARPD